MKKTSVYLEEALDEALALRAAEEGVTKAEFIRRTLTGAVRGSSRPRPSIIGIAGPGKGSPDDSSRVDELLTETGFGA
ncbi:CopG family transcriptional regulator [Patulibacter minatonensis]|uniref:ribbon-helix-helix domain-containing protein n=1 Tax=Patulibacter minatonensis TaxID=298163 RepID=UPI00047D6C82|nr:CopG family transcriptional regulator [Patulibacter minatonensis]